MPVELRSDALEGDVPVRLIVEAVKEVNRRSFATDPVAFARACMEGAEPDDWQKRFLRSKSKRVMLNCSRQVGKSTLTAVKALHRALYKPKSLILCLAPSERQSKEFFGKVSDHYQNLGLGKPSDAERVLGMRFDNGSRIEALPANEKTIRGFSGVEMLILDEASRILDDFYGTVRPMMAVSKGDLYLLSTPFGQQGFFHKEWTEGANWERYRVTALDCPRISKEFLDEERRTTPRWWFNQEYMCSFEDVANALLTHDEIAGAISEDVVPLAL